MSLGFSEVPAGNLTPFFYVEIDNSGAFEGSNTIPWQTLLIGQQLAAKTAPKEIVQVTSLAQARALFGAGSHLAGQVEAFLASNPSQPLFALPLQDAASSVAATGTVTLTGTASVSGAIYLMVAGRYITVGVDATDTAAEIAAAVVAAVNAYTDAPVTAAVTGAVVTFTAKNKGLAGNEIDLRVNHYAGEALPTGVTAVIVAMSGGAVDPDLTTEGVFGLMANRWFQAVSMPYTGAPNVTAMEGELSTRWKANSMTGGVVFVAKRAAFSALTAYGDTRNSPFSVVADSRGIPTAPWEHAAELAALVSSYSAIDPARPLQTLAFRHTKAPTQAQENSYVEAETLLKKGIATATVSQDRTLRIQRVVTTYKTSPAGSPDPSYRDVETVYTLQAIRYDWVVYMKNKYPRHKLANDGANFGPGQPVITPKTGRAEAVNRFKSWEELGWVEGLEAFKESLVVERNSGDVNRLDFLLRPNLMNQFRIGATLIRFIL